MIQSKMFKKISVAFSALLMAGTLVACGGDEDSNNTSACADGQVDVAAGSSLAAGCYDTCTDNAGCTGGKICKSFVGGQKLCVTDTATNNTTNNTNNDACDTGKVKVSYEGSEQCMTDCATDASVCGATEECTSVGSNKVCTPAEQPACGDGEVETVYAGGTKSCFKTCTGNADCAADSKICKTDDAGANMICVPQSQTDMLCETFCDAMWGAGLQSNCDAGFQTGFSDMDKQLLAAQKDACLNGGQGVTACAQRLGTDTNFQAIVEIIARQGGDGPFTRVFQCGSLEGNVTDPAANCGCGAEPSLNKPCANDNECEAGNVQASCGTDGVCQAGACQPALTNAELQMITGPTLTSGEEAGCGVDTYCIVQPQNGSLASGCEEKCTTAADCQYGVTGDMDSGSACLGIPLSNGNPLGFCSPACTTDADCPAQTDSNGQMVEFTCGANRVCQQVCDPAAMAGAAGACSAGACTEGKTAGKFGCQVTPSAN